ncbi:MAG TPA: EF-hand domain-containing protein [Kamptonema sp.]|nr:EF-hand domain-containing protein [Kamptonema sp.]
MLTKLQTEKFTQLFNLYDADENGLINFADFEKLVERIVEIRGYEPNSSKINEILHKVTYYWLRLQSEADKNRDQNVSLDEWLNYYEVVLNDDERYEQEIGSLVNIIFDVFDTDKDGAINSDEWIDFLAIYKKNRIDAEKAFAKIDNNKNGVLSRAEFLKAVYNFHHSDEPEVLGNLLSL